MMATQKTQRTPPYYDQRIGQVRYPWATWFEKARNSLRLARGKHYHGMTHSMAQQVRNAARARGIKVTILISEDAIFITRRN